MERDAPHAMDVIDYRGDEFDGVAVAAPVSRAVRTWRAGGSPRAAAAGDVALGTERGHAAIEHLHRGTPDPRRGAGATASGPTTPYAPGTEDRHNDRDL